MAQAEHHPRSRPAVTHRQHCAISSRSSTAKPNASSYTLAAAGTFDGVSDVATAFPLCVFPGAMGLREAGREKLLIYGYDLTRRTGGHVGFGTGIHRFVGEMLSRLEGESILTTLSRRAATLRLTAEPKFRINNTIRGYETIPLAIMLVDVRPSSRHCRWRSSSTRDSHTAGGRIGIASPRHTGITYPS
jgi:hypothetical protein